jgi:3-phenylpropionate/cinnamic acid dioxygenase small subunit
MFNDFKRIFGKITAEQMAEKELYETSIQILNEQSTREEHIAGVIKTDANIAKHVARKERLETMLGIKTIKQVSTETTTYEDQKALASLSVTKLNAVHTFVPMAKSN